MATINVDTILLTSGKTVGPTIGGRKPFLLLSDNDKRNILNNIKKEWRYLIRLHFDAEGGITLSGGIRKWKPLSQKYKSWKENNEYSDNILELSKPTLSTRYQRGITSNVKNFQIYIPYPDLIYPKTKNNPQQVTAAVHQLGRVKRPIIKSSFIRVARNKIRDYLTEK